MHCHPLAHSCYTLYVTQPHVAKCITVLICCAGFIGYGRVIAQILSDHSVRNKDSDQLYYTEVYLDKRVGDG